MKHGLWLRNSEESDVGRLVEFGVAAETAGWDGVFVSDSLPLGQFPDPWVTLAGLATRTETITLGTWLVPVPRRDPWQLAEEVATLDQLSSGRVMFGAGLGNEDEYTAFGDPYEPPRLGGRFDEALELIEQFWQGEPVTFEGEHFDVEDAEVQPTPVQHPRVPIVTGAWWPNKKPFHRAARWDGTMPYMPSLIEGEGPHGEQATGSPTEEVRDMLEYYHDLTDEPGDVLLPYLSPADHPDYLDVCADFGVTWLLTTDIQDTDDDALERIKAGPPA